MCLSVTPKQQKDLWRQAMTVFFRCLLLLVCCALRIIRSQYGYLKQENTDIVGGAGTEKKKLFVELKRTLYAARQWYFDTDLILLNLLNLVSSPLSRVDTHKVSHTKRIEMLHKASQH